MIEIVEKSTKSFNAASVVLLKTIIDQNIQSKIVVTKNSNPSKLLKNKIGSHRYMKSQLHMYGSLLKKLKTTPVRHPYI